MRSRTIFIWALINFTLTAAIGLALRLFSVGLITGIHYKNWLHAHSHIAFLGWIYPAIIAFLMDYLPDDLQRKDRVIRYLFWLMQCAVFGLLATFPRFGYSWPSIVVLCIHMIASIWIVFHIIKKMPPEYSISKSYWKAGAWMMVISGLGAIALGPIAVLGLKYTPWYNGSIYFYLHFQYNGWFSLALLGMVIAMMENEISDARQVLNRGLKFLIVAIILTYALSLLGFDLPGWVNLAGALGAFIQIIAFTMISVLLFNKRRLLFGNGSLTFDLLLKISFALLWVKLIVQQISSVPGIVDIAYRSRDLVIAYLHFFLLGVITVGLLSLPFKNSWLGLDNKRASWSLITCIFGFTITEIALVLRALAPSFRIPYDNYVLVIGALFMMVGLGFLTAIAIGRTGWKRSI